MNLVLIVLGLVVIGALVEALKTYVTIDPLFLLLIRLVIIVGVVYFVLVVFGVPNLPVPRAR